MAKHRRNFYYAYNYTKGFRLFEGRIVYLPQLKKLVMEYVGQHPSERVDVINVKTLDIHARSWFPDVWKTL